MSALRESLHKYCSQTMQCESIWFLCDNWFLAANQKIKQRLGVTQLFRQLGVIVDTVWHWVLLLWVRSAMKTAQQLCFLRTAILWESAWSLEALWAEEELAAEPQKGFSSLWWMSELTQSYRFAHTYTLLSRIESCLRSFHWQHFTNVHFYCQIKLKDADCALGWYVVPFYTCSAAEFPQQQREV